MGVVKRTKTAGEGYDQPNDGSQVKMIRLAIMACPEYCVPTYFFVRWKSSW